MTDSFWKTFWCPSIKGDPWALWLLIVLQGGAAYIDWRTHQYGIMAFFCFCVGSNFTKWAERDNAKTS